MTTGGDVGILDDFMSGNFDTSVLFDRAGKIWDEVASLSRLRPISVEVVQSEGINEAVAHLRRGFYKKPLFASGKEWVRGMVIWERGVYQMLATQIELEAIVDGHVTWWTGYGYRVDRMEDFELRQRLPALDPVLLRINLGLDVDPFRGLLEGLEPKNQEPNRQGTLFDDLDTFSGPVDAS